ncbi:MAG: PTS sugar transporter subunit IIA [Victivallaceae bacterium]
MKNSFTSYVSKESILILNGKTKLEVLDDLITHAAEQSKLDRDLISRMTWKREKMMTTGIGNGLALPHIRMNNIPDPVILFGICNNPIADYRSQDEQPVRVIVFIVAPDENQDDYLQLLGSISRKLRTSGIVQEILDNITRPSQILKIIKRRE